MIAVSECCAASVTSPISNTTKNPSRVRSGPAGPPSAFAPEYAALLKFARGKPEPGSTGSRNAGMTQLESFVAIDATLLSSPDE